MEENLAEDPREWHVMEADLVLVQIILEGFMEKLPKKRGQFNPEEYKIRAEVLHRELKPIVSGLRKLLDSYDQLVGSSTTAEDLGASPPPNPSVGEQPKDSSSSPPFIWSPLENKLNR